MPMPMPMPLSEALRLSPQDMAGAEYEDHWLYVTAESGVRAGDPCHWYTISLLDAQGRTVFTRPGARVEDADLWFPTLAWRPIALVNGEVREVREEGDSGSGYNDRYDLHYGTQASSDYDYDYDG